MHERTPDMFRAGWAPTLVIDPPTYMPIVERAANALTRCAFVLLRRAGR